jgi:hypothetical protein
LFRKFGVYDRRMDGFCVLLGLVGIVWVLAKASKPSAPVTSAQAKPDLRSKDEQDFDRVADVTVQHIQRAKNSALPLADRLSACDVILEGGTLLASMGERVERPNVDGDQVAEGAIWSATGIVLDEARRIAKEASLKGRAYASIDAKMAPFAEGMATIQACASHPSVIEIAIRDGLKEIEGARAMVLAEDHFARGERAELAGRAADAVEAFAAAAQALASPGIPDAVRSDRMRSVEARIAALRGDRSG